MDTTVGSHERVFHPQSAAGPAAPEALSRVLRVIAIAIGVLTIATGAVQMLAPSFVLGLVGGETTAGATHFFAIVGMFMILFGGLLWQGAVTSTPSSVGWAALQKLGASLAVGLGLSRHVFSAVALFIAAFDGASFIAIAWYWRRLRR